jgi:hypothetical protein
VAKKPWTAEELEFIRNVAPSCRSVYDVVRKFKDKFGYSRSYDSINLGMNRRGVNLASLLRRDAEPLPGGIPAGTPADEDEEQLQKFVKYMQKHPSSLATDICNALKIYPAMLVELIQKARAGSYQVCAPSEDRVVLSMSAPQVDRLAVNHIAIEPVKGHISFGVVSDTHFASKHHRNECLQDFVDYAMEEFGISRILHSGDIVAGINMYPGQQNEILCWGLENQAASAAKLLPMRNGLTWDMIAGNHDESLMKAGGADVLDKISKLRPDVENHGFYSGLFDIEIPEAKQPIKVELFHPEQAGAYAMTYHVQKAIENIPPGMKPQMLFVGHEHVSSWMPDYRGISAFQCGCFEDQTLYLKRKHKNPSIGGWIIDVGISADGSVKTVSSTWIRYFHSKRGPIQLADGGAMERGAGLPTP